MSRSREDDAEAEALARAAILDPEEPVEEPPRKRRRADRLRPLPGPYVRVPIQWLTNPCRPHLSGAEWRVFLYVVYRSHWGQRGVALTATIAAELGLLTRYARYQTAASLERKGWLRVERHGQQLLILWPIVIAA
jgi:hypothetical protein